MTLMKQLANAEVTLKGIGVSPGICTGKAYLVDREGVEVINNYCILEKHLKSEVKRFKSAVQNAKAELRAVIENSPEALQKAQILETHVLLLNDKLLYGRTIETIEKERVNAEWASQDRRHPDQVGLRGDDRRLSQGAGVRHRPRLGSCHAQSFGCGRQRISGRSTNGSFW